MKKILNGILYYLCVVPAACLLILYTKMQAKDKAVFMFVFDEPETTIIARGKTENLACGFAAVMREDKGIEKLLRIVSKGFDCNWNCDSDGDGESKTDEQCTAK